MGTGDRNSIVEVKEALAARAETTSVDALRSGGRQQVKVIRASHIAEMIAEAVQSAVAESELLGQEEVDELIERSRAQFREVLGEREAEIRRARENLRELEELRGELEEARARVAELEGARPAEPAGGGGEAMANEMVMRLMKEVMDLKAQSGTAGQGGGGAGDPGLTAALEKFVGSIDERFEKLGRKMGISSAVETGEIDFGQMFKHDEESKLESNMDSVQAKKSAGGSIAGNLARLKKLKGGG